MLHRTFEELLLHYQSDTRYEDTRELIIESLLKLHELCTVFDTDKDVEAIILNGSYSMFQKVPVISAGNPRDNSDFDLLILSPAKWYHRIAIGDRQPILNSFEDDTRMRLLRKEREISFGYPIDINCCREVAHPFFMRKKGLARRMIQTGTLISGEISHPTLKKELGSLRAATELKRIQTIPLSQQI